MVEYEKKFVGLERRNINYASSFPKILDLLYNNDT